MKKTDRNFIPETPDNLPGMPGFTIRDTSAMPVFMMTLTSCSDLWMFICSNGGLTAGRGNADVSLFPYGTEDKLAASVPDTGPVTLIRAAVPRGEIVLWEPFAAFADVSCAVRSVFKTTAGDAVVFSETRDDLHLTFRYAWRSSAKYGFIRTSWIENHGKSPVSVEIIDGLRNIMPWGIPSYMQESKSCLCDAYKRSETRGDGLAVFALSSIIVDRAEPAEALRANTVWNSGFKGELTLSESAVSAFRCGRKPIPETDIRGGRGAYLLRGKMKISAGGSETWSIVADVAKDQTSVDKLGTDIRKGAPALLKKVLSDAAASHERLIALVASSDGIQDTGDPIADAHHFSNTLFNIMRGGVFANGGKTGTAVFSGWLKQMSPAVYKRGRGLLNKLPAEIPLKRLQSLMPDDDEYSWLAGLYLPLCFGRRHGDPSRPWNKFSISAPDASGNYPVHYEGNWRDVFQNWEALAYSYPEYADSFVSLFLSSTTADGYNPYRVTERGFDWEVPNPADAWSHIGYWSDHQIIYLEKLIEASLKFSSGNPWKKFSGMKCAFADVPYRIRPYADLLKNAEDTVDYDNAAAAAIHRRMEKSGDSGKYAVDRNGKTVLAGGFEKMMILLLAKLANFVPDGGIWMNTQRPEWNDANNALAGKGLSMVTVCYLRRYAAMLLKLLEAAGDAESAVFSAAVFEWMMQTSDALIRGRKSLENGFTPETRRKFLDEAGGAASSYRMKLYANGISEEKKKAEIGFLKSFIGLAVEYLDASVRNSRRSGGLYHAYNTVSFGKNTLEILHLQEMLEGQVAVLSSGLLSPRESLSLLKALRSGGMYRNDQHSYMLYPEKIPLSFFEKNRVSAKDASGIGLLADMLKAGDIAIISRGAGCCHFNGDFRKAGDLAAALDRISRDSEFAHAAKRDRAAVLDLFERTFRHAEFTGRSGSFFAYEGIGSIYWHMVAKLLVAAGESIAAAVESGASASVVNELAAAYADIRNGLGANKTPEEYGAFPTDPYSHTPRGGGARQPGMTGQVKEELLARLDDFGVKVSGGRVSFEPGTLPASATASAARGFAYYGADGKPGSLKIGKGGMAFTFCGVPVIYSKGRMRSLKIGFSGGTSCEYAGTSLDEPLSSSVFTRSGKIKYLIVTEER